MRCDKCPLGIDQACNGEKDPYLCKLWASGRKDYLSILDGSAFKKPNIAQQAINFGKAVVDHALDGFKHAPEQVKRDRLTICESCIYMSKDRECTVCGCPVDKKVAWNSESCPKGYWAESILNVPESSINGPGDFGGCGCGRSV